MSILVNRGAVHFTIPNGVVAGVDKVKASTTVNLINIILTLLNERDSINTLKADPKTTNTIKQLNGILDKNAESTLVASRNKTTSTSPVYASDVNVMIKYVNELVDTCGVKTAGYQDKACEFPKNNQTIIKYKTQPVVPNQQQVDPVTGEPITDINGDPVMIPGFKNPVPLLDSNGKPTYYTVTGKQIFIEGPINNKDEKDTIVKCGNTGITCPNRVAMSGYDYADEVTPNHIVYACSNPTRSQLVYGSSSIAATHVTNVDAGQMIKADTINNIISDIIAINAALDTYRDWWGADSGCKITCQTKCQAICQGACQTACELSCQQACQLACQDTCQTACQSACQTACQLTCQISCQQACQLACQSCHGGTCHNQNCGGFS